jgi:hypothetical protein
MIRSCFQCFVRLSQILCVVLALGCLVPSARAAELQPPTVFDGAYQGLLVGGLAGLSVGYLFARQDGLHSGDWVPLVYGGGIGALTGSVLGLTLGIVDMAQRKPGRNGYVMRDGLYGAGFGAVLGGIVGGLAAISSKKGEHVLLGGSIGALSGTCLGMGLGFVEGYRKYSATVAAVGQSDGSVSFVPAIAGRF